MYFYHRLKTTLLYTAVLALALIADNSAAQQKAAGDVLHQIQAGYRHSAPAESQTALNLSKAEIQLFAHNPQIQSAYGAWKAAEKRIAVARGLPDPRLSAGYFIENVETAVGPQEWKAGVTQAIPWPGKLSTQAKLQSQKAAAAEQMLRATVESQRLKLYQLYYDWYYLQRQLAITRQNIDLVEHWEEVILIRYKSDAARHASLIKTQIEVLKLNDDLAELKARQAPLIQSLKSLLNLEGDLEIQLPDSLSPMDLLPSKADVLTEVLNRNPLILASSFKAEAQSSGVQRARMNYLPDLTLGIDRIFTGRKLDAAGNPVPEAGKDPWIAMGSISIPLWFGKQKSGVEAARHEEHQARSAITSATLQIRKEFEQAWYELENARRKAELYGKELLPKAEESIGVFEIAYRAGNADFLDLIDAQRRYLQFQLAYEQSLVHLHQASARLDALAGRTL